MLSVESVVDARVAYMLYCQTLSSVLMYLARVHVCCCTVLCDCAAKVILVAELLSLSIDANVHGDIPADEFNLCRAGTKSQRYLDSLYRCHPGNMSLCVCVRHEFRSASLCKNC